jgi:carboxymethylenebutenolidase
VSRTIGTDQLVDEMIFRFTHTMEMDWLLPGQLGILSANGLPVAGVEIVRKVLDPSLPSNQLMGRR